MIGHSQLRSAAVDRGQAQRMHGLVFLNGLPRESFGPKTILYCTDFSPSSLRALAAAVRLCKTNHATLLLLHVYAQPYSRLAKTSSGLDGPNYFLEDRKTMLDVLVREVRDQGIAAHWIFRYGVASETILQLIEEKSVDVAVIGSGGSQAPESTTLGSTAEAVLRQAQCPVVNIGPHALFPGDHATTGPVVFATDFSDPAPAAIRYAATLANHLDSTLHCIHVLPASRQHEQNATRLRRIVKDGMRYLLGSDIRCVKDPVFNVAYGDQISQSIANYTSTRAADLLVLGVQRASPISPQRPPQVTRRSIVSCSCPVLTIGVGTEDQLSPSGAH